MIRHDADLDLLVAGALLDDLDPTELERFEAHQAGCERCARLMSELDGTLGDLALIAPTRRPPASLGRAVSAAIAADRPTEPRPARSDRVQWPSRLGRRAGARRLRLAPALAVGFAVVAVAFGAWGVSIRSGLDRATADAARTRDTLAVQAEAMAVVLAPDHRTATLEAEALAPGAEAMVVYQPGRTHAYLLARDLPATPIGSVYQLWAADTAGVHGLGTFEFDGEGAFVADFEHDLAGASAVMVTLEPVGGSTGEPGPQVVFGEL